MGITRKMGGFFNRGGHEGAVGEEKVALSMSAWSF
jgi:hypothetical protein